MNRFFATLIALATSLGLVSPATAETPAQLKAFIEQQWGHVEPFDAHFLQYYDGGGRSGGIIEVKSASRIHLTFNSGDEFKIEAGAVKIKHTGSHNWETYPLRHMAPLFRRAVDLDAPGVLGVGYDPEMPRIFPQGSIAVHMHDPSGEYTVQAMVYFDRDGNLLGWREFGGEGGHILTVIERQQAGS